MMSEHPTDLSILAIDDDDGYVDVLKSVLEGSAVTRGAAAVDSSGMGAVTHAPTLAGGITEANALHPDVILVDLELPDSDGTMSLDTLTSRFPESPIVVLVEWGEYDKAFEAIDQGAADFLMKGMVVPEVIERTIELTVARHQRTKTLTRQVDTYKILFTLLGDRLLNEATAILGWGAELKERSEHEAIANHIIEAGEDCVHVGELATIATEAVAAGNEERTQIHLDEHLLTAIDNVAAEVTGTIDLHWPEDERKPLPVQGSPFVKTALTEVLKNALLHSDQQSPNAAVHVTIAEDEITVEVVDNGVGMSSARSRMLSDPNLRYETAAGIGVGLFIVTTVIEQVGGSFEIRPNESGGMTASLTFERL